ncbi:YdeI/OmpD-associated family protein [Algoriphagus halophytocola]|uniref:YdeI/OmpD-associated family protein n=1 Tax=Algoriphagus halophytocola TaxID=2991499 RepID=UPI0022DDC0A0|nr:YdeI/OmpD-associated family protein [Algoriphagus sp. TR-M9]WBL43912.1 YdeI/OmpD-associated family protein [Algoriphagus sp. TR-M9]
MERDFMTGKNPKTEQTPEFCPADREDWRKWLERNHQKVNGIWLIIYKKSSSQPNLTWSQAVDEALCFGWIDSTKRPIDDVKYKQYFGKRKVKSNWSKINKEKIAKLLEAGKMRPAGLQSVQLAKENGSWDYLDAIESLQIPTDLEHSLNQNPESQEYFTNLSKSKKKQILYWVHSAKRIETRKKRIEEVLKATSQKKLPKQIQ